MADTGLLDAPRPDTGEHPIPVAPKAPRAPKTKRARSRTRRWFRRIVIAGVVVGLAAITVLAAMNLVVTRSIDGLGYDDVAAVPHRTVAIVFGAKVFDSTLSNALADRVDGAVALYKAGKVDHLLVSGDNSNKQYDEPTAMRDAAIAQGVPSSAITRDYAGLSTYDTCLRARDVFGVRDAVLVTQDYHLARAMFTCRELGIDAVGLRIPDFQHLAERLTRGQYPNNMAVGYHTREWLARANALWQLKVTHPAAEVPGPFVGLVEN